MLLSINTWCGTLAVIEQLANSLQFYLIHLTGCLHNLILTPVVATFAAVVVVVVVPGPPASASLLLEVGRVRSCVWSYLGFVIQYRFTRFFI